VGAMLNKGWTVVASFPLFDFCNKRGPPPPPPGWTCLITNALWCGGMPTGFLVGSQGARCAPGAEMGLECQSYYQGHEIKEPRVSAGRKEAYPMGPTLRHCSTQEEGCADSFEKTVTAVLSHLWRPLQSHLCHLVPAQTQNKPLIAITSGVT
jgi:hypothetical protein